MLINASAVRALNCADILKDLMTKNGRRNSDRHKTPSTTMMA